MKKLKKLALFSVSFLFLAGAKILSAKAEAKYQVEVSRISVTHALPTLEDFCRVNAEIADLLSQKVGLNVACYIVPETNGYVVVWIDADNVMITAEVRATIKEIVKRRLHRIHVSELEKRNESISQPKHGEDQSAKKKK